MKIKNNDDEYNIVYEINDISKKDKGKVELYII